MRTNISDYNVIYTVPGQTDRSAMPMGNGELCASVWISEDGIVRFYPSRTDALMENDLTAKLGMVRLSVFPAFPKEWSVRFRLHAPHRQVVECEYENGELLRLDIGRA